MLPWREKKSESSRENRYFRSVMGLVSLQTVVWLGDQLRNEEDGDVAFGERLKQGEFKRRPLGDISQKKHVKGGSGLLDRRQCRSDKQKREEIYVH